MDRFSRGSTGRDVQVLDKALELVDELQLESVTMLTNVTREVIRNEAYPFDGLEHAPV